MKLIVLRCVWYTKRYVFYGSEGRAAQRAFEKQGPFTMDPCFFPRLAYYVTVTSRLPSQYPWRLQR